MKLGAKLSVCCYDGTVRTGKIVYVHPKGRFATLEFAGASGTWRESFFLRHPKRECRTCDTDDGRQAPKIRTSFSSAEDKAILASHDLKGTARKLGRPYTTVFSHRKLLRRIADAEQTRFEA